MYVSPSGSEDVVQFADRIGQVLRILLAEVDRQLMQLSGFSEEALAPHAEAGADALGRTLSVVSQRGHQLLAKLTAYSGLQELRPDVLELLPYISNLAYLLLNSLDKRIDVTVNIGHDCPPCLVDLQGLEAALQELVANACEAMPTGGRLQLAARSGYLPKGEGAVCLSVMDNGRGMLPEVVQYAMQPFFTTKIGDPLAGMGLAAVDGFARQSGGSLSLRSAPGMGCHVTLTLPQPAAA